MATRKVIDTANPSNIPKAIPAIKKAGVTDVILYCGIGGAWKRATKPVVEALRKADLGIIACVESKADWMLGGRSAGIAAAKATIADIRALGGPEHPFMWPAHDVDSTSASDIAKIVACFGGMRDTAGAGKVDIYGSGKVILAVRKVYPEVRGWESQSTGWSGFLGRTLAQARGFAMFQEMGQPYKELNAAGINYDGNTAFTDDLGQWDSASVEIPVRPGALYRLMRPSNGDYLLTMSPAEAIFAIEEFGYIYEGILCILPDTGTVPIWRMRNKANIHHYVQRDEVASVIAHGWNFDSPAPAFYGLAPNTTGARPVNRWYDERGTLRHLWSVSAAEAKSLPSTWSFEGPAWWGMPA